MHRNHPMQTERATAILLIFRHPLLNRRLFTSTQVHFMIFHLKYKHLCVIIHLSDFFTWIIYTSVQLHSFVIFYPKYIHRSAIIHHCDFFTWSIYIHLSASPL